MQPFSFCLLNMHFFISYKYHYMGYIRSFIQLNTTVTTPDAITQGQWNLNKFFGSGPIQTWNYNTWHSWKEHWFPRIKKLLKEENAKVVSIKSTNQIIGKPTTTDKTPVLWDDLPKYKQVYYSWCMEFLFSSLITHAVYFIRLHQ